MPKLKTPWIKRWPWPAGPRGWSHEALAYSAVVRGGAGSSGAVKAVSGVILAAGLSTRAGCYKMTCLLDGKPMIERCVEAMEPVCGEIIVVGGYRMDRLEFLLRRHDCVRLVRNENYERGMYSSVQAGLGAAAGEQVFVTPGDCPLIPTAVYRALLGSRGDVAVPVYQGRSGHPVRLSRRAVAALLAGRYPHLRAFVESAGCDRVGVDEPGILVDLDTPGDRRRVGRMLKGEPV